ncbi:MAG: FtsW/RodA/SpoVE family cell cycle protein [Gordonia sp. (in: high G+C Gram-positive bacteria)]|uniref:FtsW/RodA/SpoVE family cell cycle protein n=1 Tax=Gordonia sp. (in: high G+C Gram-positive bacteria) TaxID=84139 RepID=UPI0039E6A255
MSAPAVTPHAPAPTKRDRARRTELWLLLLALGLFAFATVIVEIAQDQPIGLDLAKYVAAFAAIYLVVHFAVRFLAPHADPLLVPVVALLNGLGLVLIHRLDLGARNTAETLPSAIDVRNNADQQLLWTAVGVIAFVAVLYFLPDHRTLARYAYTLGFGGLFFLALPILLPDSISTVPATDDLKQDAAKLWIRTPFFSIQPSEFAKVALIVFTAALLVSKRDLFTTAGKRIWRLDVPRARDMGPLLLAWLLAFAIFGLQRDLGPALLIFMTILTMLYIATGRVTWVVIGLTLFAISAVVAYHLPQFHHIHNRVEIWKDPFADPTGSGMQIVQSLFGLANGGLFGTGLGSGRPNMVPLANTDFILASLGEELGLVGLAAVLCLFLVLGMRGLRTGITVRDSFGKLLAAGLAATLVIQLFIVGGGVTKLIPLTGLTTPFLSYGGSSLVANFILLALLVRVSNAAREPQQAKPAGPTLTSMPTTALEIPSTTAGGEG